MATTIRTLGRLEYQSHDSQGITFRLKLGLPLLWDVGPWASIAISRKGELRVRSLSGVSGLCSSLTLASKVLPLLPVLAVLAAQDVQDQVFVYIDRSENKHQDSVMIEFHPEGEIRDPQAFTAHIASKLEGWWKDAQELVVRTPFKPAR